MSPAGIAPFTWDSARMAADVRAQELLERHGLLGLWAARQPEGLVGTPLGERVERVRRGTAARYALLRARVDPELADLVAQGLTVVAVKGLDLAESLYPGPSLRPMADADIWCPGEDAVRALGILRGRGWRVDPSYADVERWGFGRRHECALLAPGGDATIDLHRELVPPGRYRLETVGFLERAEGARHLPAGVRTLARADHVLFLAVHMAGHHGWESLARAWEVAAIWQGFGDAERVAVVDAAARAGCRRALALALEVGRTELGMPVEGAPGLDGRGRLWWRLVVRALALEAEGQGAGRWREVATIPLQADGVMAAVRYGVLRVARMTGLRGA